MSSITDIFSSASARDTAKPAGSNTGLVIFRSDTKALEVSDGTNYQTYNSDGVFIPGVSNTLSASFDGTDDFIDCGTNTALNPSAWTITQWIRLNTNSEYDVLTTRRSNGNGYQIYAQSGDFKYYGGNVRIFGTSVFAANTWYNVTVTHSGSSLTGYVDGAIVGSAISDTYVSGGGANFYIGRHAAGTQYTNGYLDEIGMWNSVLTAEEIASIYNRGVPIDLTANAGDYTSASDLLAFWRMGDGLGDTDSGGGSPASGDTIGTVKNVKNPGTHDGSSSGATYSDVVK